MSRKPAELDCESILQMLKETPDAGAVIFELIAELKETDANCLSRIRELEDPGTEFDCASILQMLKETPDAGAVIMEMIAELEEADENCLRKAKDLQAAAAAAA